MCCVESRVLGWWRSCKSKQQRSYKYSIPKEKKQNLAISTLVLLSNLIRKSMKSLFHGACFLYINLIFSPLHRSKLICTMHPAVLWMAECGGLTSGTRILYCQKCQSSSKLHYFPANSLKYPYLLSYHHPSPSDSLQ